MIINHKRKFVFVCVPKTASTTLSKFFQKHDKLQIEQSWFMEKWHYPISQIQKENNVQDYYSFAYHRNPFDRLVSSWIEFTQDKGHLQVWSRPLVDKFKTWEDFVLNFPETSWANEIHFRPTTYYTHNDDKQQVNFIARYDHFDRDTKVIFDSIGLAPKLLNNNKRYRKTNRDKDYRTYYKNDKAIEAVAKHFDSDIKTFGDSF
tara:strand:+ start:823 stop:1434 length:612 start_codon:yes stop_codon:yes gene_type:complete